MYLFLAVLRTDIAGPTNSFPNYVLLFPQTSFLPAWSDQATPLSSFSGWPNSCYFPNNHPLAVLHAPPPHPFWNAVTLLAVYVDEHVCCQDDGSGQRKARVSCLVMSSCFPHRSLCSTLDCTLINNFSWRHTWYYTVSLTCNAMPRQFCTMILFLMC